MARFHDPMGSEGCRIVVTGYVSTGEVMATPGAAHVTPEGCIVEGGGGDIPDNFIGIGQGSLELGPQRR